MAEEVKMFRKPTQFSKPIAKLQQGRLCLVVKCKGEWCKIKVEELVGWVKVDNLWGRY